MRRPSKLTHLVLIAVSLVCLHVVCLLAFRAQATLVTYPFLVLAPLLACASCCWRATTGHPASRSPWILLSAGMFLWTCGIFLSAWEDIFQHLPQSAAWFSDFSFFLYGVPVLLAISSVSDKQRIPFFIWMDAAQALLTGFLVYVSIFSVMPFSDTPLEPVSATTLVLTYNAENFILAVAASLRLLAQPRGQERRFYALLACFLWVYAVMAYIYNNWAATTDGHAPMDILVDLPFLFLAVAAVAPQMLRPQLEEVKQKQALALFIENVSPIFYTVALLTLSISLMHEHFYAGTVGIFTALVVYATRSTTLQGRPGAPVLCAAGLLPVGLRGHGLHL
uniref:Putative GGDEF domain protein n=1 Tax=termite gut metagenome TaxID=433724 RepID=S0DEY0_9ZZZZ